MEIYTQDLFELSIQSTRIQTNFQTITSVLKELQQQVFTLTQNNEKATSSLVQNQTQIQLIRNRTEKHHSLIHQHQKWMEQLNSQFGSLQISSYPTQEYREGREIPTVGQPSNFRLSESGEGNIATSKQASKPPEKNGLQQIICNIKERLKILQRDNQHKDAQIEEICKLLPRKPNQSQYKQKRVSIVSKQFPSKNKLSKRQLKQSNATLQFRQNHHEDSTQNNLSHNDKMIPILSEQQLGMKEKEKLEEVLVVLSRDLEKMKEAMGEKNRILDSHIKENHQKIQTLQKNMDILERSHDMLKYDFEKTSTSFTKTSSHEHRRHEDRLNDTRITNKEYYEDKLVQLFNDMEFLKNQYFQLQAKLEKEAENDPEEDKNQRKVRIAQKLMGSQRVSQESLKGEMMLQRQQLKRIRQQFQSFAFGVNHGSNQVKTILIKPNQNKQDWKSLSSKMQKLKMEVNSSIRELEGKIVSSNQMIVEFNQIGVAIEECKLLLKRKVEHADFDKATKRMEGKLNHFIMQVYEKQGQQSQFDAAIAKQPWFCLSCDSQLKNYTGKVGKTNQNVEKLVGRKVNTQSHMVRRNQNGRLPSVIK